jgi:hypothetical protein
VLDVLEAAGVERRSENEGAGPAAEAVVRRARQDEGRVDALEDAQRELGAAEGKEDRGAPPGGAACP